MNVFNAQFRSIPGAIQLRGLVECPIPFARPEDEILPAAGLGRAVNFASVEPHGEPWVTSGSWLTRPIRGKAPALKHPSSHGANGTKGGRTGLSVSREVQFLRGLTARATSLRPSRWVVGQFFEDPFKGALTGNIERPGRTGAVRSRTASMNETVGSPDA